MAALPERAPDGAPVRTVELKARRYEFEPSEIRVRQGDLVTLVLVSEDVTHGFGIAEIDLDVDLPKGQPVEVRLYAGRRGEIPFECTHFCGWGHPGMDGTIVVE